MKDEFMEWLESTGVFSQQAGNLTMSEAAVRALFNRNRMLTHALDTLETEQNDAPLEVNRNGWNAAMWLTEWALRGKVSDREASPYRQFDPTCYHGKEFVIKDGLLLHKDDGEPCR